MKEFNINDYEGGWLSVAFVCLVESCDDSICEIVRAQVPEYYELFIVEDAHQLSEVICEIDIVFVFSTFTDYPDVSVVSKIAQCSKVKDAPRLVSLVTNCFGTNIGQTWKSIESVWSELLSCSDNIIKVPSHHLKYSIGTGALVDDLRKQVVGAHVQAIDGFVVMLNEPNFIGLDYGDILSVLRSGQMVCVGRGEASGTQRGCEAGERAMNDLLQSCNPDDISGIIIDISGHEESSSMADFMGAAACVQELVSEDAKIVIGFRYPNICHEVISAECFCRY